MRSRGDVLDLFLRLVFECLPGIGTQLVHFGRLALLPDVAGDLVQGVNIYIQ